MALGSFGTPAPCEKTNSSATDPRLETKVTCADAKISFQYLVMELARQAGLGLV